MNFIARQIKHIQQGGSVELIRKINLLFKIISRILTAIFIPLYRFLNYPLLKFYQFATPKIYMEDLTSYLRQASVNNHTLLEESKIKKKSICLFTRVWGGFINYYDVTLMRSLFQEGNILQLLKDGYQVTLNVHILESEAIIINEIIKKYCNTLSSDFSQSIIIDLIKYHSTLEIIENSLSNSIRECISNKSIFFMANPDTFYGNYSISNIVKLNMGRQLCIASVHFRVNDADFLRRLDKTNGSISNPSLVTLAMRSPHQTLRDSFIERENCSYATGLTVQRISDCSFAATFRAPTVYLANFNQSDLKYFKNHPFNNWDHEWPTNLMLEGRYKCIGSSDAFFAAELTGPQSHLCIHNSEIGNDEHEHHKVLHKELHRNFLVIVRSSEPIETAS